MINSITSGMSMPPQPPRTEQNLSEDQQLLISDTLSQFDADNISEADAVSIVDALSKAGIQPGAGLEKSMSELGFNAKSLGGLANVSDNARRPPPPPNQNSEELTSMVDYLAKLLEEKRADNNNSALTDEDKQSILAQVFKKFDIEDGESIIDTSA